MNNEYLKDYMNLFNSLLIKQFINLKYFIIIIK